MELLQLKYFQVIARTQHISQAACELHIAQPSLSQTLKRLETELGTPLFDRVGKHIVLNDAGTVFLKYVDQIFLSLKNASLELDTYQKNQEKNINLYIHSASLLLPGLFQVLKMADPALKLHISQRPAGDPLAEHELVISSTPQKPKPEDSLLLEERLLLALPKTNELAQKSSIYLEDLLHEDFLSLSRDSCLSSITRHYCAIKGFVPDITAYIENPDILRELLKQGAGIAFIPELTWKDFSAGNLITRTVTNLPMKRFITLSWNREYYQTPAMCLCRRVITDYFTRLALQAQP